MATNKNPALYVETEKQEAMTVVHCTGQVCIDWWAEFSTTIRALISEGKPSG